MRRSPGFFKNLGSTPAVPAQPCWADSTENETHFFRPTIAIGLNCGPRFLPQDVLKGSRCLFVVFFFRHRMSTGGCETGEGDRPLLNERHLFDGGNRDKASDPGTNSLRFPSFPLFLAFSSLSAARNTKRRRRSKPLSGGDVHHRTNGFPNLVFDFTHPWTINVKRLCFWSSDRMLLRNVFERCIQRIFS